MINVLYSVERVSELEYKALFHITHFSPPRCIHDGERLDCGRGRRWDFVDQLRKVFLDPLGIPFFSDDRRPQIIRGTEKRRKKVILHMKVNDFCIPVGNCFQ